MKEWIKEEEDTAPILTEEHKQLLNSLPKLNVWDDHLKELCKPWKDALILTLMGRRTSLNMKDKIFWLLKSENFELIDLPNNYYVFRSGDKGLCLKLLFDGPWLIQGHYLAVQRWSPNFNPYCNKVRKLAIWVRVPTLPMHVYSEDCMLELGNLIGKALKVDLNTLAQKENHSHSVSRGKFAQVSVEVDLNKQLQSRFVLRRKIYTVEYEGLDVICFKCGMYGHNQEDYPLNAKTEPHPRETRSSENQSLEMESKKEEKHPLVSVPGIAVEEEYGSWMKVRSSYKQRSQKAEPEKRHQTKMASTVKSLAKESEKGSGSQFDILQEEEANIPSMDKAKFNKEKGPAAQWKRKETNETFSNKDETQKESKKESVNPVFVFGEASGVKAYNDQNDVTTNEEKRRYGEVEMKKKGKIKRKENMGTCKEAQDRKQEGPSPIEATSPIARKTSGRKRNPLTRPKVMSPLWKKKQVGRTHQLVFGSLAHIGPLDFSEDKSKPTNAMVHQEKIHTPIEPAINVDANEIQEQHWKLEKKLVELPEKPPDPSKIQEDINIGKDQNDPNDLWFETQDEVREETQGDEAVMELLDSGQ